MKLCSSKFHTHIYNFIFEIQFDPSNSIIPLLIELNFFFMFIFSLRLLHLINYTWTWTAISTTYFFLSFFFFFPWFTSMLVRKITPKKWRVLCEIICGCDKLQRCNWQSKSKKAPTKIVIVLTVCSNLLHIPYNLWYVINFQKNQENLIEIN